MMRTTVELEDNTINEVMRLTGARTKKDALRIALEDYVSRKSIEAIMDAAGTMDIDYVRPEIEEAELAADRGFAPSTVTYGLPAESTEQTPSTRMRKVAEKRQRYS